MAKILMIVLFLHWFGDFVCQSRYIAENKGKSLSILTIHVGIYCLVMFFGLVFFVDANKLLQFVWINFMLHWITDLTSSQITSFFWKKKDIHKFFATVGFDQFVHQVGLLLTVKYFFQGI